MPDMHEKFRGTSDLINATATKIKMGFEALKGSGGEQMTRKGS
jgi:hypothetical protein